MIDNSIDTFNENNKTPSITSKIDPKEIKSLFILFNGKPDSTTRIFPRDVIITLSDLLILKAKMEEKLKFYDIVALIESINVRFEDNKFQEFSNWYEFEKHNWTSSYAAIENMVLKWDFMMKVNEYNCPQRHTIVVRLSSGMKLQQILQMMINGKIEDLDSIDKNLSPVICDVTFVNHLLGEEIINIVDEWNKGLKLATIVNKKYSFIRSHSLIMANLAKGFTRATGLALIVSTLCLLISNFKIQTLGQLTINNLFILIAYSTISYLLYGGIKIFSYSIGETLLDSLNEYGEVYTFDITKGDNQKQAIIQDKNKEYISKINNRLGFTIFINIVCSIIATYISNKIF